MEINSWSLFQHPLFKTQFEKLLAEAEHIKATQPDSFHTHKTVKLLAKITTLIIEEIPADPGHDRWNQGSTLGKEHRHWKRAKFGRYRLFFRYLGTKDKKAIVYAWVNDEKTLRTDGDKNDPYAIFARGLKRGEPPNSFEALLKESADIDIDF